MTHSPTPIYPTDAHRAVTEIATAHFAAQDAVDTILLVNSLARGQGTPRSDVDMAVLVKEGVDAAEIQAMETAWAQVRMSHPTVVAFEQSSRFAHIHLDVISGHIEYETWDDGGGPDYLEVGVGNQLVYALPLTGHGAHYRQLQAQWLPYYAEDLRRSRLAMVRDACL
ncbi:MAG: nucleotidyltransferase domain-containing protein [Caldilineaceae bacterium]